MPGDVDVIFTSHTLEHLDDVKGWLLQARERVNANGVLVIHIPAWTCERWRADQYDNPMQPNRHRHTFCLARDAIPGYCAIDKLLAESDWNVAADYCGDDSIFLIARKQ
jgi:predicted SAM-dependent methyltransferase